MTDTNKPSVMLSQTPSERGSEDDPDLHFPFTQELVNESSSSRESSPLTHLFPMTSLNGENVHLLRDEDDDLDQDVKVEDTETFWSISIQIFIPFLIAGLGMVGAGLILDVVQHWPVFIKVPEVFILVPALLGKPCLQLKSLFPVIQAR